MNATHLPIWVNLSCVLIASSVLVIGFLAKFISSEKFKNIGINEIEEEIDYNHNEYVKMMDESKDPKLIDQLH